MNSSKRILIFRQSSLGDVVLTLPVLDLLKKHFPDARIDFLTKSPYAPLMKDNPVIEATYEFHDNGSFLKALGKLRGNDYNLFIDLQANFRSLLIKTALFPIRSLSYKKRRLAREKIVRNPGKKLAVPHTVHAYLDTVAQLGIPKELLVPKLLLNPELFEFASHFFAKSGISPGSRIVALCPGAKHFEKRWPEINYKKVAEMILENPRISIVVVSSESDNISPNLGINHSRLITFQDINIMNVAAVLSRCELALTNDSGLMHLANAVGTPVLAIFGPTNPCLGFAPLFPGSKILCDDVICSPCSLHGEKPCHQPEKICFKGITPARALAELLSMLDCQSKPGA